MRKITTIIMAIFVTMGISAHESQRPIADNTSLNISGISVRPDGETAHITFDVHVGDKAVKSNELLSVTPVLISDTNRMELMPVAVRGRKARISAQRAAKAEGTTLNDDNIIFINKGQHIKYEASAPLAFFGKEGKLLFESQVIACGNSGESSQTAINDMVNLYSEMIITELEPLDVPLMTTADRIAVEFPFVAPQSEASHTVKSPNEFARIVYFELDKSIIDYKFKDNSEVIRQIISIMNVINDSDDSNITEVVIAGFASPEGGAEHNKRLSERRAVALRDHLSQRTGIPSDRFLLESGGAHWDGLRKLVDESDMKFRSEVLDIIDNTPIWDVKTNTGRMSKLMKLDNGNVYRYMKKEFFPDLRNAAYLMIYYENN